MHFNANNFGRFLKVLTDSPYVFSYMEAHPIPPISSFHLLDDDGAALLDDSDAFLITPSL